MTKIIRHEADRVRRIPTYATRRRAHPVPEAYIYDPPTYCFQANAEWVGHILGALESLLQPDSWLGTEEDVFVAHQQLLRMIADWISEPCQAPTEVTVTVGGFIGEIKQYYGECPDWCLPCDGATYAVSDYPELAAVLEGNTYAFEWSDGDVETFQVPDLNGRMLLGNGQRGQRVWGTKIPQGQPFYEGNWGGEQQVTLTDGQMPQHDHEIELREDKTGANQGYWGGDWFDLPISVGQAPGNLIGGGFQSFMTNNEAGGDLPHNNMPPYAVVKYCIVARVETYDAMNGQFRLRQNADDNCKLEQTVDDGATWTTAFNYDLCQPISLADQITINNEINNYKQFISQITNIYDGTTGSVAPDVAAPANETYRDKAICFAVNYFVDHVFKIAEESYNAGLSEGSCDPSPYIAFGLGLAALTVGLAAPPVGATLLGLGASTWSYATFGIGLGALSYDLLACGIPSAEATPVDFQDATIKEKLACCMYDALEGTSVSFVQWQTSLDGDCNGLSGLELAIKSVIRQFLQDEPMYVQIISYMQDAYKHQVNGFSVNCPCTDPTPPETAHIIEWAYADDGFAQPAEFNVWELDYDNGTPVYGGDNRTSDSVRFIEYGFTLPPGAWLEYIDITYIYSSGATQAIQVVTVDGADYNWNISPSPTPPLPTQYVRRTPSSFFLPAQTVVVACGGTRTRISRMTIRYRHNPPPPTNVVFTETFIGTLQSETTIESGTHDDVGGSVSNNGIVDVRIAPGQSVTVTRISLRYTTGFDGSGWRASVRVNDGANILESFDQASGQYTLDDDTLNLSIGASDYLRFAVRDENTATESRLEEIIVEYEV